MLLLYPGKQTAAVVTARHLLACSHWESVYWADLTSCKGSSAVTFALLVAFGVASCSPEVTLLHVSANLLPPFSSSSFILIC